MLKRGESYEEVYAALRWDIPRVYNMAFDVCDRHAAEPGRTALIYFDERGHEHRYAFNEIRDIANKLANALTALGIRKGDRVAILLPQAPETAITHVALYKMGAVALPLFTLFGEDALEYRLSNSGAAALVTNAENLPKIAAIRPRLADLKHVILVEDDTSHSRPGGQRIPPGADHSYWSLVARGQSQFRNVATSAEDPAFLVYTSGTTGQPKGALHAHRSMLAHMPSMEFYHSYFPEPGDLCWSPADWAWIGGLMDNLMPAWFAGVPVLAWRARKFDPEEAFAMMAQHRVRNCFFPPTALKMMRQVPNAKTKYDLRLRSMFSGGETMGEELLHWGYETFGIVIAEGYGQTECNLMVGNCPAIMDVIPGSMGRAVPGHVVEIVDEDGKPVAPGTVGQIAFKMPDPIAMIGYWNNPEATKAKHKGEWMLSGDLGMKDAKGYLWFKGRADDVITSAGYRIGPGEIEECLMKHPAVGLAAVIGVPDPMRTEAVKAFIVLATGHAPSDRLAAEIQAFVRTRLSAHEYPRHVEFVNELPLTATGKIRRLELREREKKKSSATESLPRV
ncbi:MAG TPA: acyl-CoA synthetase [Alphaproteobacteria bacterium]|jgi:acetyl-CoA synthetase